MSSYLDVAVAVQGALQGEATQKAKGVAVGAQKMATAEVEVMVAVFLGARRSHQYMAQRTSMHHQSIRQKTLFHAPLLDAPTLQEASMPLKSTASTCTPLPLLHQRLGEEELELRVMSLVAV